MDVETEVEKLRIELRSRATCDDTDLSRYSLDWPPIPVGWYWRLRWFVGWMLRGLEMLRLKGPDGWPAKLVPAGGRSNGRPLLVLALGTDKATLRDACAGFAAFRLDELGFAPVLVTDVADFYAYSRLGWLVEYVPAIRGEKGDYRNRKLNFIARLYRGAPVLPVEAGLDSSAYVPKVQALLSQQR